MARSKLTTIMTKFADEHELIINGNKVQILHSFVDDAGQPTYLLKTTGVSTMEWSNRLVPYQQMGQNGECIIKRDNAVSIFIQGLDTGCAEDGYWEAAKRWQSMTFLPGKTTTVSYNLFKGFPVEPKEADTTFFYDVMHRIYGEDVFSHIVDWFADMYQNPGRKCTWSISTRGVKRSGKNTVEEMLGLGLMNVENYFRTADKEKLFGRFSKHLASNLLTVGQEIVWGGDHNHDSTLKELITENTRSMEAKGVDAITLPNYTRLYMTSNADWVVPASGKEEKRYFVADTKTGVVTKAEFKALYQWYEDGGGREALMHDMVTRDLSDFDNISAPWSAAVETQLEKSLYGLDRYLFDAVVNGYFGAETKHTEPEYLEHFENQVSKVQSFRIKATYLYANYREWNPKDKKLTQVQFRQAIEKGLGGFKRKLNGQMKFEFSPLDECKETFQENYGFPVESDVAEWQKREF